MSAFDFMASSPVLTFLLALVGCTLLRAAFRFIVVMVYGYPPMWCDSDGRFREDVK